VDIGAILFAVVLATIAGALAAVVGFAGGIFLCGRLFTGEATESALAVGPLLAVILGVTAFILTFRKLKP
jgi:hypothetical protein